MSIHGQCDNHTPHVAHVLDWAGTEWHCPGQFSECRNCDDRKCMGCVFREHDHTCKDDCPECC